MTAAGNLNVADILGKDPWFKEVPPLLQSALLQIGVVRRLRTGQRLFSRGDPTNGVYALLDGRLAALDVNEHGSEAIQLHLDPVSWFGEMGLYDRLPRVHHIRAERVSTVLWLNDQLLRAHLEQCPQHWHHFGLLLTQKLRLALFILDGRKLDSNDLVVARTLLMIAQSYVPGSGPVKSRVTIQQQEVADMLGMSRQTVSLALQRLKAEGILQIAYGKVEILDVPALQAKVHYENWLPVMSTGK
ncbi:Crp/Fnr family transcriptional regulator [Aquabacterium sp. CECT 9606]|uniref:Crp/Fnr family transcriptional regulator n=1 Tax=Aquabacterium sp. CECT 9606 TaxID=2845822 RepID=UPI001E2A89B6|nr:Crp/Fnr family transcriptional regulator [Aquabacterium sp. CECT 9606]CAH0351138.1 CRP-like cAMP-activated global transcriptional regulator [Aquabacterium sp. CECT 9606]